MTTTLIQAATPSSSRIRTDAWLSFLIWAVGSVIAVTFALLVRDSSELVSYTPFGNDSFYHARRILDAAVGTRGFYEFDERLHAPDGMWIPWPWGYDYLVAQVTKVALLVAPGLDPIAFLLHIPVAWVLVNAALFLAAARACGLSLELRMLAMILFAFSPFMQMLHSIGAVDHHFVEHTFVLLAMWLGLRWFEKPNEVRRAAALAVALGLAPAFHNGLFMLQLLPLAAVFVLWLRGSAPAARALYVFAIVLVSVTQLVLLPSGPYRAGMFDFGLLSWFHFYVAACTAAAVAFMAWHPRTQGSVIGLFLLCAVLATPLAAEVVQGMGFLSGTLSSLDQVIEVRSPYRSIQIDGLAYTVSFYSWLAFLSPVLIAVFAFRLLRVREPREVFFAVAVVFGLSLFLSQMRFVYFGFFTLVAGSLLLVEQLRQRFNWHRGAAFVATFAAVAFSIQPALNGRLFRIYFVGGEPQYEAAGPIFGELESACAAEPGLVLADSNDGSAILYHSECSVIANNFILTREDDQRLAEIKHLLTLPPAELRSARPDVKYLFLRSESVGLVDEQVAPDNPLAKALLFDPEPPEGFTVLRSVYRAVDESGPKGLVARLYKLAPRSVDAGSDSSP